MVNRTTIRPRWLTQVGSWEVTFTVDTQYRLENIGIQSFYIQ